MKSINDELWKFKKYKKNIKEFKIIKNIGNGGFAVVNLVEHIKTKERYAAKTILPDKISKKQIYREIEIMSRFQTSTFLKFHGFSLTDFENKNNITLFMEYAENISLNYILRDEKFSLAPIDYDNTTRQIIAIGTAYSMLILNQNLIIHRDLTPGNIFIDSDLHPKLGDFGLSKQIEIGNELFQSKSCGTLIYKSPENDQNMQYGMKNDVYSFGLILSEIFTGELPYPEIYDKSFQYEEFIEKIKEKKYEPKLQNCTNKSIETLILKCLSINPNERPSFEEIFYKLAYNFDDDNEDDNYFLPGVNAQMISEYVESITDETTEINSNNINIIVNDIIKHENVQKQKITLFEKQIMNINQRLQKINNSNKQILKLAIENNEKIENLNTGLNDNKKEINDISTIQKELISNVKQNIDELKNIDDKCKNMNEQIIEQSKKEDDNIKQLNEKIENLNTGLNDNKKEINDISIIQKELISNVKKNIDELKNIDDKCKNMNEQIIEQSKKEDDNIKQLNVKIEFNEKKQVEDNKQLNTKLAKDIDKLKNELEQEMVPIQQRTAIFDDSLNKLTQKIKDNENEIKSLLNHQSKNVEKCSNYDESFRLIKNEIDHFKLDVADKVNNINERIKQQIKKENDDVKQLNEKIRLNDQKQADDNTKLTKDINALKNELKHEIAPIQKKKVRFDDSILKQTLQKKELQDQETTHNKYYNHNCNFKCNFNINYLYGDQTYSPKLFNYNKYGIGTYEKRMDYKITLYGNKALNLSERNYNTEVRNEILHKSNEKAMDENNSTKNDHQKHLFKSLIYEPPKKNDSPNIIEKTEEKQKNKPLLRKKKQKKINT